MWYGEDGDEWTPWRSMIQTCHKMTQEDQHGERHEVAHDHFITLAATEEEAPRVAEIVFRGKLKLMGIEWS